jgi:hypothetical protein
VVKRIIQIVVVVACIGLIGYVYFQFSGEEKVQTDSIEAVPSNAAFLMQITSFENLHPYKQLLYAMAENQQELAGIPFNPVVQWGKILSRLDSLRLNSQNWYHVLNKGSVYFISSEQNRGDSWLMSIGLNKGNGDEEGELLMKEWGASGVQRKFEGTQITVLGPYQYAIIKDCLVLATSNSMMEDAIIRSKQGKLLRKDEVFGEAHRVMSDDLPMHFFVKPDEHSWLQLDPIPAEKPEEALTYFTGYCIFGDSSNHHFKLTGDGGEKSVSRYLPSNTVIVDEFKYEDFETGWQTMEKHFIESDAYKFWSQAWKTYGDSCACDLNEAMLSWRGGEWGTAVLEINDSTTAEVLFYHTKDSVNAIAALQPVLAPEPANTDQIYSCKFPQLFERNQTQSIPVEANYVTQVGTFLFAASTPNILQGIMNSKDSLAGNKNFALAHSGTRNDSGRLIYQTRDYISTLPQPLIRALSSFDFITTEITAIKGENILIRVGIPFKASSITPITTRDTTTTSENISTTTAKIISGPFEVTNHNNGEKENLVQFENGEISLINQEGKELWRKMIKGKILGSVTQIDVLKNNKLQMVFATESGIHLIDRNGNELSGFPVLPEASVISPLHVADYDATKKYRLLVGLENGQVLNLNVSGKTSEGWKYMGNSMTSWIDHFKIGNEDYLMTVSLSGKLSFLKRTGDVKYSTSTELADYNGESCKVILADKIQDINIQYTTKNGESKTVKVN